MIQLNLFEEYITPKSKESVKVRTNSQYYTVYLTINTINSRYYYGMHQTNNPDDSYIGSGNELTKDIKIYGRDNFLKIVLFVFHNRQDMVAKEKELITKYHIENDLCYNKMFGGYGGPVYGKRKVYSTAHIRNVLYENRNEKFPIAKTLKDLGYSDCGQNYTTMRKNIESLASQLSRQLTLV